MIRVLEVLATLKRAGAEMMATSLACGLDRERFTCGVVSLYDAFEGGLEPRLEACGIPVWHLGKRRGFDIRMFRGLREVVKEFRPDVIHTHSYVMRYTLLLQARAMVHTVHNLAEFEVDQVGRMVHRFGFSRRVVPVAIADAVARSFEKVYGMRPAATIPNGVDLAPFASSDDERVSWRRANGFAGDDLLIVSAARLEPQKNPLLLAEAFARLGKGHLLMAGEGSLRPVLQSRERVHLLGAREDLPAVLKAGDIFVLASNYEGHPLALMEAMAAGLPVIATAVGGVPEIAGDAGLLIPPGDLDALTQALSKLAVSAGERRQLGAAARLRSQQFNVNRMVAAYEALFTRVTA